VGRAEADIIWVYDPAEPPDELGGGGAIDGPLGIENAPVAELPPPSGGGGAIAPCRLGLPNICVNSPACALGRVGAGVSGGALGCHWLLF
jgi:hypothetical protein